MIRGELGKLNLTLRWLITPALLLLSAGYGVAGLAFAGMVLVSLYELWWQRG